MIKFVLAAAMLTVTAIPAAAGCVGTSSFQNCWDDQGNNYSIHRFGNSTQMYGSNARTGSTWSQNSYNFGNTTINNGLDSRGRSWSTTCTGYGCY